MRRAPLNSIERNSYFFLVAAILLTGWFHLGTPFLTVLFSYFALHKLNVSRNKILTVVLFLTLLAGIFWTFVQFLKEALVALPSILDTSIPSIIDYARRHKIDLPFDDIESMRSVVLGEVKAQLAGVANFARIATKEFVFLSLGIIIAIALFLKPRLDLDDNSSTPANLYAAFCRALVDRFHSFYESFALVTGAQLSISAINTFLTTVFILCAALPHVPVLVGLTFLAGLIPIIGNLISNSIIVAISFTHSPHLALSALVFLIVLHKLEYFLNSKIIGARINNPIWLTLIGLIVGEKLMGIPGMILAPVILNYIKVEASKLAPPAETA